MLRTLTPYRVLSRLAVLAAGFTAACSSTAMSPEDNGITDPALAAAQRANLAAIATARAKSAAVYDSLVAAWRARTELRGPMYTADSSNPDLLPCAPLPFDGEAQIIGPEGGRFYFGPHRLFVPAGALSQPTSIAVMVLSSLTTEVTLLPHGIQFSVPVKLSLAYAQCVGSPTHRVAYVDDDDNILSWPASTDRPTYQVVDSWLSHFSQYAIAY